MASAAEFAYARARIGARHGLRLQGADWKALESAHSLSHYLEQARATYLRRFLTQIGSDLDEHAIERVLRREASSYAEEVAAFAPSRWRPAISWLGTLALLPLAGGLAAGAAPPEWLADDPLLAAKLPQAPKTFRLGWRAGNRPAQDWLRRWRECWPRSNSSAPELTRLVAQIQRALSAERRDGALSGRHRSKVARLLTRSFRTHGASPIAIVCHVALTLLDIERLRGALARRRLFGPDETRASV